MAKIVCYLVGPADPERVARLVRTRARRSVAAKDLVIVVGPVEPVDEHYNVIYRVLPFPDRLGA